MAIGSLIAFVALLAGVALFVARPWAANSLVPQLRIGPGIGIALDDSVAVVGSEGPSIAAAQVAVGGRSTLVVDSAEVAAGNSASEMGLSSNRPALETLAPPAQSPGVPAPQPETVDLPAEPPPAPAPAAATEAAPSRPLVVANLGNGLRNPSSVGGGVLHHPDSGGAGSFQVREGAEYVFSLSFYIESMVFAEPGTENTIVRFNGDQSERPGFGLQLWEYPGDDWYVPSIARGLWASGDAMGGDRFLAPVPERAWHELVIHFKASNEGAGFYEVFLDGQPIDARSGVSLIEPGSATTQIEVGLFREGERVEGTSEIRIDAAELGETLESPQP